MYFLDMGCVRTLRHLYDYATYNVFGGTLSLTQSINQPLDGHAVLHNSNSEKVG